MSTPPESPSPKKWTETTPSGALALEALLVEVDLQTEIATRSYEAFVDEWDRNRPPHGAPPSVAFAFPIRVWGLVHAILTAGAIVSRIACEGSPERKSEIRLALGAMPAPILESRDLRNSLDHIDERIAEFVASIPSGSPTSPVSYETPRPPDRILRLMLRYLNPEDTHVRIFAPPEKDRDVVLRDIVLAMRDLNQHHPCRFDRLRLDGPR
jgi:hypothetical protein